MDSIDSAQTEPPQRKIGEAPAQSSPYEITHFRIAKAAVASSIPIVTEHGS